MKTVAIEDIIVSTVLTFCENLAELGCPINEKSPDMWFRYLSPTEQRRVALKMLDIEERYTKGLIKENDKKTAKKKKRGKK